MKNDEKNIFISEFISVLIDGDRIECSKYVKKYLKEDPSIKNLYENILKVSLYEVGRLWENNKISVATEHLSTAIVESILNELYEDIMSDYSSGNKIIAACTENELHQVGIKMVADIFEMNGYESYFLGSNVPVNELITFAKLIHPDVIALSLSVYFHLPDLEAMIYELQLVFESIKILVGGQAFLHGGREMIEKYQNVNYLPDLDSVELWIKSH